MQEYSYLTPVQANLLQQNTIDLDDEINRETINYVREVTIKLAINGLPPINVLFHSSGGDIQYGFDVYDLIANYQGLSTGIVVNFANSMAAIILQACQKRFCVEHGHILIHNPARKLAVWNDFFDRQQNKKTKKIMLADREDFIKVLLRRTGRTRQQIIDTLNRGKSLTATEALRFGLIDEIIDWQALQLEKQQSWEQRQ